MALIVANGQVHNTPEPDEPTAATCRTTRRRREARIDHLVTKGPPAGLVIHGDSDPLWHHQSESCRGALRRPVTFYTVQGGGRRVRI
jgi:hypothetical protein